MPDLDNHLHHHPVAIVGMGAIMPQAHSLREFWNNIVGKVDCISDVPESRWRIEDYYDPDPTASDKTYCKRGGFIPDVDFDPMEFGLPPNILEVTDVSQMLSLLVAKEALTDAGYAQGADDIRERTGVILGVGGGQKLITPLTARLQYPIWDEVLQSYGISDEDRPQIIERMKLAYIRWEENSFPGMLGNVIAGRIANRFDLGGTNCVVDAACASTLAALRMAVSELTEHRADMMLTGGVDTDNSIFMYMCFSKTPAFSKGNNPRPFDTESDGMLMGEGIGMMVLKRLADAERDGDRIYAVIKGIGSSSDGRYKSIYAPRGEGQEKALRRAYEDAGISPATVGLVEAHGTGTVAGDTTEVTTIVRYFNQHDSRKQHVALGSVKSQIGHTKASAGAAGMIKTALAIYHKILPPTLNVEQPNPKFDLPNSAFYVNTEARPWVQTADKLPRRAGVSSFGFGGTNFHVVLEEYRSDHHSAYRVHSTPQAIILTAGTPAELLSHLESALTGVRSDDGERIFLNLVRASRTVNVPAAAARVGFVAATSVEAATMLQIAHDMLTGRMTAADWQHPKGVFYRRSALNVDGHVVALFPGQGAQYLGMGRELLLNFPEMRQSFARLDSLMAQDGKSPLSDVVFPPRSFQTNEVETQEAVLQGTDYAQPAIGAFSAGLYRLLYKAGFRASFTAGHSFGELTALWAAGVLDDDSFDVLVKARGAAMAPPPDMADFDAGTMMAVTGDIDAIEREIDNLPGVQMANRNSRSQVVVAGAKDAVKSAEAVLKAKGFKVVPLPVSAAFHTPLVGHAQRPFAQAIDRVTFNAPQLPVYSNSTGKAHTSDPTAIRTMLASHILNPVLFRDEIEEIYAAGGTVFVEFGPRNALTNLVNDILGDRPHIAVALNGSRQKDSDRQLREAAVQLQVLGLRLSVLDPYTRDFEPPVSKKGMTVKLNGSSYVSDKTRAVYQAALASGGPVITPHREKQAEMPPAPPTVPLADPTPSTLVPLPALPASGSPNHAPAQAETAVEMIAHGPTLELAFREFREHQRETLRMHEQYTQVQAEYFRIFFELTQQQQSLLAAQALAPASAEALSRSMLQFHEYQSETLRMHEHYMQRQTEIAQSLLAIVGQQYAVATAVPVAVNGAAPNGYAPEVTLPPPVISTPPLAISVPEAPPAVVQAPRPVLSVQAPVLRPMEAEHGNGVKPVTPKPTTEAPPEILAPTPGNGTPVAVLAEAMLRTVGEKTGYPVDMLELSMDMESDLGIDSIKRVEILGAMREAFPELPQFNPEELGELRTLGQIVDHMQVRSSSAALPSVAALVVKPSVSAVTPVPVAPAPPPIAPAGGLATEVLAETMLRIVGDKTGYPVDMLELSMDMEADLGIDSIKRVEILGAMRESFPNLPQFSPEELGELRTLQQIVDYMEAASRTSSPFDVAGSPPSLTTDSSPAAPLTSDGGLSAHTIANAYGVERRVVDLLPLPAPDYQEFSASGAVCLLTDDGSSAVAALRTALSRQGWVVVCLGLPAAIVPVNRSLGDNARVQLERLDESSVQNALSAVVREYGRIGAFIHLNPARRGALFDQQDKALVKYAFLMAKCLKPALTHINGTGERKYFITLTRLDGALGATADGDFSAIAGGLFGLVKTLALEWDQVFCRAVDVSPDATADQIAVWILTEMHDPNRLLTEVGYGSRGRSTLAAFSGTDRGNVIAPPASSTVFLVSGGALGITAQCVVELARQFRSRFVLFGRTSLADEPSWAQGITGEAELKTSAITEMRRRGEKPVPAVVSKAVHSVLAQREIRQTVATIKEAGGDAVYVSVDITDRVAMQASLTALNAFGPITGVIHGAGNLADKLIEHKTEADFETVYSAKVTGLENILAVVPPAQLDYLILFSSVAGFYGNVGQADYAMANEILNKTAHQFRKHHPACRAIAINWGPWDGGMVTPQLREYFDSLDIKVIPVKVGTHMLADELRAPGQSPAQIVIGSTIRAQPAATDTVTSDLHLRRRLRLADSPFLRDHVVNSHAVLPMVSAMSWMANACEQTHRGYHFYAFDDYHVLKGILFDETLADAYTLDLTEASKTADEIVIDAMVRSQNPDGKPRFHYKARLMLRAHLPPAPLLAAVTKPADSTEIPGAQFYRNGTLFHGPSFQGVDRVLELSERGVIMRCTLPPTDAAYQGQFPVHAFNYAMVDIGLHGMGIWSQHFYQMGSLPLRAAGGRFYRQGEFGQTYYVTMEVRAHSETHVIAEITLYDEDGRVYVVIDDLEVTMSRNLNELFLKNQLPETRP